MEKNIGPHEHQVTIYDSYETYAVCRLCGMHDWSEPPEGESYEKHYMKKYPKNIVLELFDPNL